jgi:chromosome segregation ATPase
MARLYLLIIVLGIVGGVAFAAKSYYEWSEQTIATLRENNIKLASAAETLQNTVDNMAADAKRNEELNQNLSRQLVQSRKDLNVLRSKFARIDLTMEALQDPVNLEERVDRAVNRLIDDIANETTPPSDTTDATGGVSGENSRADSSN